MQIVTDRRHSQHAISPRARRASLDRARLTLPPALLLDSARRLLDGRALEDIHEVRCQEANTWEFHSRTGHRVN